MLTFHHKDDEKKRAIILLSAAFAVVVALEKSSNLNWLLKYLIALLFVSKITITVIKRKK